MNVKQKNVTFSLPIEVVEKLRGYVKEEQITSLNAGVKEALEAYTVDMDRRIFKKEMQEAAKDLTLLKDIKRTMKDFADSDQERDRGEADW